MKTLIGLSGGFVFAEFITFTFLVLLPDHTQGWSAIFAGSLAFSLVLAAISRSTRACAIALLWADALSCFAAIASYMLVSWTRAHGHLGFVGVALMSIFGVCGIMFLLAGLYLRRATP